MTRSGLAAGSAPAYPLLWWEQQTEEADRSYRGSACTLAIRNHSFWIGYSFFAGVSLYMPEHPYICAEVKGMHV